MAKNAQFNRRRIEELCRELLIAIGENPNRPGLRETPERYARWWEEFIQYEPGTINTTFESTNIDSMVVVQGIRVWSLCEHHLLPFWCDVSIAYIPTTKVLGLSKFGRIAQQFAHQLQIQEQLANQIADQIESVTESPHVAVLIRGEHLCMTMRGIRTPSIMSTSVVRGAFKENSATRSEFFSMVNPGTR